MHSLIVFEKIIFFLCDLGSISVTCQIGRDDKVFLGLLPVFSLPPDFPLPPPVPEV